MDPVPERSHSHGLASLSALSLGKRCPRPLPLWFLGGFIASSGAPRSPGFQGGTIASSGAPRSPGFQGGTIASSGAPCSPGFQGDTIVSSGAPCLPEFRGDTIVSSGAPCSPGFRGDTIVSSGAPGPPDNSNATASTLCGGSSISQQFGHRGLKKDPNCSGSLPGQVETLSCIIRLIFCPPGARSNHLGLFCMKMSSRRTLFRA